MMVSDKLKQAKSSLRIAKNVLKEEKAKFKAADKIVSDDPTDTLALQNAKKMYGAFLKAQKNVAKINQKIDILAAN